MSQHVQGWIGVDLDGTLASYTGWVSEFHIGPPVPAMVERVRYAIELGFKVKIFTARVYGLEGGALQRTVGLIFDWCREHIGQTLDVTCIKDYQMLELWDDRAVGVERNTGLLLSASKVLP